MIDDETLRRMARGDGSVSDDATYAQPLAAEVLALRAIIDGRTVPPSAKEIEAHAAAGGEWLLRWPWELGWGATICTDTRDEWSEGAVCIALDAERKPCAWPVVGGGS